MRHKCFLALLFISFISCRQAADLSFYNEKDYVEKRRGPDDGYPFVIVHVNKNDTNYSLKKVYFFDSTYSGNSFRKDYFYKNTAHGPFISYIDGKIGAKGTFKMGKYSGERLSYHDGVLRRKAYFDNGIKTGKWEDYDEKGKLINVLIFDKDNLIKTEKIN